MPKALSTSVILHIHPSRARSERKGPNALRGAAVCREQRQRSAGSSGPALDSWQGTTHGSAQPCGHSRSRIPLLPPAAPAARPARPALRFCSEPAPRSPDRARSLPARSLARRSPAAAPPARVAPPAPHSGGEGARPRPRGRGEGSRPGTPRGAARTETGAAPAPTSAMSPRRPPSQGRAAHHHGGERRPRVRGGERRRLPTAAATGPRSGPDSAAQLPERGGNAFRGGPAPPSRARCRLRSL